MKSLESDSSQIPPGAGGARSPLSSKPSAMNASDFLSSPFALRTQGLRPVDPIRYQRRSGLFPRALHENLYPRITLMPSEIGTVRAFLAFEPENSSNPRTISRSQSKSNACTLKYSPLSPQIYYGVISYTVPCPVVPPSSVVPKRLPALSRINPPTGVPASSR